MPLPTPLSLSSILIPFPFPFTIIAIASFPNFSVAVPIAPARVALAGEIREAPASATTRDGL